MFLFVSSPSNDLSFTGGMQLNGGDSVSGLGLLNGLGVDVNGSLVQSSTKIIFSETPKRGVGEVFLSIHK